MQKKHSKRDRQHRVVLFDADGVVITPHVKYSQLLESRYGVTQVQALEYFAGDFLLCTVGQADLFDTLTPFLKKWHIDQDPHSFVQDWFESESELNTNLLRDIAKLRSLGYLCCLATNQERHRFAYMKTHMGLEQHFDQLFVSCELGVKKPDKVYFEKVLEILDVPAKDVTFFDDSPTNVESAHQVGISAHVFTESSSLADFFSEL